MRFSLIKLMVVLSIGLCLQTKNGYGQNDVSNHRKYWYYRSRLVNDFMKVGLGQGEINIKKVVVQ